jgi:hypothetical protein
MTAGSLLMYCLCPLSTFLAESRNAVLAPTEANRIDSADAWDACAGGRYVDAVGCRGGLGSFRRSELVVVLHK